MLAPLNVPWKLHEFVIVVSWKYYEIPMRNRPILTHWSNLCTLVLEWATELNTSIAYHFCIYYYYAHGIFLPSPIPTVFPSCAYAICVHNYYTVPIPYATLQWAPQKLIKVFNCHIETPSNCFPKTMLNIKYIMSINLDNRISPQYIATCTFCLKCRTELLKLS